MTDWKTCPAVERSPRKISGAWAFTGTRVPVYALFENLESGATVKQFLEWYPEVKEWQVSAVLGHEAEHLEAPADHEDAAMRRKAIEMTSREACPAVERTPGKVSGAWVFAGTRIPLYALYENLAGGATIDEFVEWFPGVDEQQVRAVLEHEARALRTVAAP